MHTFSLVLHDRVTITHHSLVVTHCSVCKACAHELSVRVLCYTMIDACEQEEVRI